MSPAECRKLKELAANLFDAGWWINDEYPGVLVHHDNPDETMQIELSVWFFIAGIRFGLGEAELRRREREVGA